MSKPAITDLEIWAKGRDKDHKEDNYGHTKEGKGKTDTGDDGPGPYCCAPVDPDPDPDEG